MRNAICKVKSVKIPQRISRKSVRAAVSGSHKESDDERNFFVNQNAAGGEDSEAPAMAWETLSSQD